MLTYEDRLKIYKEEYDASDFGVSGKHLFRLLSLVCILTKAARKKNPDTKVLDVLAKCTIVKEEYYNFVERVCLQCDSLLSKSEAEFDNYGFTKATDIVEEIKKIMSEWLPF